MIPVVELSITKGSPSESHENTFSSGCSDAVANARIYSVGIFGNLLRRRRPCCTNIVVIVVRREQIVLSIVLDVRRIVPTSIG